MIRASSLILPRWAALVIAALIVAVVVLFSSGAMLPAVIIGDGADLLVLSAWILAALGIGRLTLSACRVRPSALFQRSLADSEKRSAGADPAGTLDPLLLVTSEMAIGLGVIGLLVLGLGLVGFFTWIVAIGVIVLGLALLLWQLRRRGFVDLQKWLAVKNIDSLLACLLAFPLSIAVLGATMFPGRLWKPLDPHPYDVMSYHLQIPREWFDAGRIIPLHHNAFSFFPMGMEMHYLLAMRLIGGPWAAMYLCQFMSLAMGGLTVLAVVGSVRQLGGGTAAAWLSGLVAGCVPWTTMLSSVTYVEPALMLYTLLAIVWAIIAMKSLAMRPMGVAGVMAGLACGIKYTAVAMTVGPMLLLWPVAAWQTRGRHVFKPWLIACTCCAIVGSPWLLRNMVWTGNPVFPLATSLFGKAHFTADQVERYQTAHQPPPAERAIGPRIMVGFDRVMADWQFGIAFPWLVAVAGIVLIVRRQRFIVAMIATMTIVWLVATHDMPRFLTPVIPLGVVMLGLAIPRQRVLTMFACLGLLVQASFGLICTWQTLSPTLDIGRQGFFRLPGPLAFDSPALQAAKSSGAKIAMIGDAQAFFQEIDSSRLLYRGVFDVNIPPGISAADGWLGKPVEQLRREGYWVIINTDELARLSGTYAHIPPPAAPYDNPMAEPVVLPPTGNAIAQ